MKENIFALPVSPPPPGLEIQDNSLICRIKKSGKLNMVWINIVELFNSVYTSYTEIGNTCRQYTVHSTQYTVHSTQYTVQTVHSTQ